MELVDSTDLGSVTSVVCGFESRRPHHLWQTLSIQKAEILRTQVFARYFMPKISGMLQKIQNAVFKRKCDSNLHHPGNEPVPFLKGTGFLGFTTLKR